MEILAELGCIAAGLVETKFGIFESSSRDPTECCCSASSAPRGSMLPQPSRAVTVIGQSSNQSRGAITSPALSPLDSRAPLHTNSCFPDPRAKKETERKTNTSNTFRRRAGAQGQLCLTRRA